MQQYEMHTAME